MQLGEAATVMRGELCGRDARFDGVAIDSRNVLRGDLFVAIDGEHHDGHDFIQQAAQRGAVGAVVAKRVGKRVANQLGNGIAQVAVRDTTFALGQLGAHWRARFDAPLIAITGSNGKTTVTALTACILNRAGDCLAPRASFNNQWGVPLTLLRLRARHSHVVIEMGMNHPGEIDYLSRLSQPTIALINNAAPAHLAGLRDVRAVARAKGEILNGLDEHGVAVLNADNRFYEMWRESLGKRRALSFGMRDSAQVRATDVVCSARGVSFELHLCGQRARVHLALLGAHNAYNACAAAACAHAAGADLAQIAAGLDAFESLGGRLQWRDGMHGAQLLDDTYNANPASMNAALDALAHWRGARIAVLGAMAELGEQSDAFHHAVGAYARKCGVRRLFCLYAEDNPTALRGVQNYLRGFGADDNDDARAFADIDALLVELTPQLTDDAAVLIKGSRAATMERVVARLTATADRGASC